MTTSNSRTHTAFRAPTKQALSQENTAKGLNQNTKKQPTSKQPAPRAERRALTDISNQTRRPDLGPIEYANVTTTKQRYNVKAVERADFSSFSFPSMGTRSTLDCDVEDFEFFEDNSGKISHFWVIC